MKHISVMSLFTLCLLLLGLTVPSDIQHKGPVPLVRVNTDTLKQLAQQLKAAREKRIQELGESPRMVPAIIRLTDHALIDVNHPWTGTPVINATVTSSPYPTGIERRLFSDNAVLSMGALFFNADPTQAVCFFVDPLWNRVIFGNKSEEWIRSYGEWHGPPRNEYYLAGPRALTVDAIPNNYVYVADTENDRIVKLNYGVGYMINVATFHDARMMHPVDISLSFMGDYIWIADDYSGKILRMERSGGFPGAAIENYRIGTETIPLRRPSSVCADDSFLGERLGLIDGATNTFVLGDLTQVSGNTITAFASTEFNQPGSRLASIGVDINENWWVADPGLGLVHVFDIFGEYLGSLNRPMLPDNITTSPYYFDGVDLFQVPYLYTAEKWNDERGLRAQFPGADVIDMRVEDTGTQFRLSSVLTNACLINVKVVRASDGSVVQTLFSGSSFANPHRTDDVTKSSLVYGNYKFRVEVKPLHNDEYGGNAVDWLVREIPFTYSSLSAPQNVVAVGHPSHVQLTWSPVQQAERYNIYRNGQLVGTSYETEYLHATSEYGQTLEYYVTACSGSYEGSPSAIVSAQPLHLQSTSSNVTAPNSQRKVVRDHLGTYHMVYESGQAIWYSRSTDNGVTWLPEMLLSGALDPGNLNRTPSIAFHSNTYQPSNSRVLVIWEAYMADESDHAVLFRDLDINGQHVGDVGWLETCGSELSTHGPVIGIALMPSLSGPLEELGEYVPLAVWYNGSTNTLRGSVRYSSGNWSPVVDLVGNASSYTLAPFCFGTAPWHLAYVQENSLYYAPIEVNVPPVLGSPELVAKGDDGT